MLPRERVHLGLTPTPLFTCAFDSPPWSTTPFDPSLDLDWSERVVDPDPSRTPLVDRARVDETHGEKMSALPSVLMIA